MNPTTTAIKRKKKAEVDVNSCVACGCCEKACPKGAIKVIKGVFAKVNNDKCIGCGICAKECPASVIAVKEVY